MSQTTYVTLSLDEIRDLDDSDRMHVLEVHVQPEQLETLEVSAVMPYFAAFRMYEKHVDGCQACQDTPVWDIGCEVGAQLAHISADAMAAQDDLAAMN